MGIIYTTPDPGDWHSWLKRDGNKSLPLKEAKVKYLKEQLVFQDQMSYHYNYVNRLNALASDGSQGAKHGIANSIKEIEFQNTPLIQK